jgi:antitoxin ParD1/3/4
MNVSLTKELERMLARKVSSGMYSSASEVIREALRLLEQKDRIEREHLQRVRAQVAEGLADAQAGRVVKYDKAAFGRRIAKIKAKSRKQGGKGKST